jgi:hypothetical protein
MERRHLDYAAVLGATAHGERVRLSGGLWSRTQWALTGAMAHAIIDHMIVEID